MKSVVNRSLYIFFLCFVVSCGGGGGGGSSDGGGDDFDRVSRGTALRVIHASIDAFPVSVVTTTIGSEPRLIGENIRYGQLSSYIRVDEGFNNITVSADGISSSVVDFTFLEDGEYTLLLSGSLIRDDFSAKIVSDITQEPEDSNNALIRFINAVDSSGNITAEIDSVPLASVGLSEISPPINHASGTSIVAFKDATGRVVASSGEEFLPGREYTIVLMGSAELGSYTMRSFLDRD